MVRCINRCPSEREQSSLFFSPKICLLFSTLGITMTMFLLQKPVRSWMKSVDSEEWAGRSSVVLKLMSLRHILHILCKYLFKCMPNVWLKLLHHDIRYFKQIAKSVRSNGAAASGSEENADDFLGCINIPLNVSSNSAHLSYCNSEATHWVCHFCHFCATFCLSLGDPGRWLW